jgi:hypothetical protein
MCYLGREMWNCRRDVVGVRRVILGTECAS